MICDVGISSIEDFRKFFRELDKSNVSEALQECIKYLITHGNEQRDRILFFNREILNISPEKSMELKNMTIGHVSILRELIKKGIEKGEFKVNNPDLLAFNIWALQQEWVLHSWVWNSEITINEYINQQTDFFLKSISTKII